MLLLLLQLEDMRKNEDPRLSFSTPEFKEAQRVFTDGFKVRPVPETPRLFLRRPGNGSASARGSTPPPPHPAPL